jgi:hypothetical protein
MLQFNLLWSEHIVLFIGTIVGFFYILMAWGKTITQDADLIPLTWQRSGGILFCLFLYLAAPLYFIADVEKANIRYIHTLRDISARRGQHIESDRVPYIKEMKSVKMFTGETITLEGSIPGDSGLISLKGTFTSDRAITASTYHVHSNFRAVSSYLGMFLYCILCFQTLLRRKNRKGFPGY